MTEDKPFNFIVGERWSSDDKPYEELVTILGKPIADAIIATRNKAKEDGVEFVVNKVDPVGRTITISYPFNKHDGCV